MSLEHSPTIHTERAAYTIDEFCAAHRISRRHFYDLCEKGIGPDLMKGTRPLVSIEAAARWRVERERDAA